MRVSYQRDREHNYMIIEAPDEIRPEDYQVRMLVQNKIPGLLKSEVRMIDGIAYVYCEITSRQPLSRVFHQRAMGYEDIQALLTGLEKAFDGAARFLLDENCFLMDPSFIYMDIETRELGFCYLPSCPGKVEESFRQLAEYLLKKLDHEDEQAVLWGYRIYSGTMEENYSVQRVLETVYQRMKKERQKIPQPDSESIPVQAKYTEKGKDIEKEQNKDVHEQKNRLKSPETEKRKVGDSALAHRKRTIQRKKQWIIWSITILLIVFFVGGVGLLAFFNVLNLTQAGGICFLGFAVLFYFYADHSGKEGKRKRKKKETGMGREKEVFWQVEEESEETAKQEEALLHEEEVCSFYEEAEEIEGDKSKPIYGQTILLGGGDDMDPMLISMHPENRENILLNKKKIVIGKLKGQVDVVLSLPAISRLHASIEQQGEAYFLMDLNSTNGTFLNGKRLQANVSCLLQGGDEISFAGVNYYFQKE